MRLILCLVAVIMVIATAGSLPAAESEPEAGIVELEKIVITAKRAPTGLTEVSDNVTVIGKDEIEQMPARNLSEALNYIPGVYIQPTQGFGRASSVSIQGSDSRHVRVMIDGIPLNSQASGQVNPAKFPIENVARIEVIKGAASSTWGSGLGGVINIITKDTGDTLIPKGKISSSLAEFRTKNEDFELAGKADELGYYISSSYMESAGEGLRDDVLDKKAFGKLSYDLKEMGKIITSFGYTAGDVNTGQDVFGGWAAQPYMCQYGKLGWSAESDNAGINLDLKYSRQNIITKLYFDTADDDPYAIVRSKDVHYQGSLVSTLRPREEDLLVVGADLDWDILKSIYISDAKKLDLQAPYANYTLKIDPYDFIFGLRYDRNSEFGQDISPLLGAVYHLENVPDTLIRADVSRAFNAPPLLWKHIEKDLSGIGVNPDIKPEHAWVYELGLETRPVAGYWFKVSAYRSDVSDAIALDTTLLQYRNFQKFRRQGVEAEARIELYKDLSLFGASGFNDIEDRSTGKPVRAGADSPRQSFDFGLDYKNIYGFGLFLKGYYERWNRPASFESKDREFLFDLKATQEIKNFTLFLNIYNLTNAKWFIDVEDYPVPKRYFEGGVSVEW